MACRDPDRDEEAALEAKARMRALTVALCFACKTLVELDKLPAELRDWYRAHTSSDSARKKLEEAERGAETMRKKLAGEGLFMTGEHKLIVLRDKLSGTAQEAYTTERFTTLRLLKLLKETT